MLRYNVMAIRPTGIQFIYSCDTHEPEWIPSPYSPSDTFQQVWFYWPTLLNSFN